MTTYILRIKNGFGLQTNFDDVEVFETPELRDARMKTLSERHPRLNMRKLDRDPVSDISRELVGYQDFTDTGLIEENETVRPQS